MNNQKQLKRYAKLFIEKLLPYMRRGFVISADIYPSEAEGAVIEFNINDSNSNITLHQTALTINKILENIDQRLISENISGVKFGGTNISMEDQRIVLIKGEDGHEHWNNRAVDNDIERIVAPHLGATK